jgi:hypothetical protein
MAAGVGKAPAHGPQRPCELRIRQDFNTELASGRGHPLALAGSQFE